MRTVAAVLVLAAPLTAVAAPVCDPDAPPGDRGPVVGRYVCQLTRDGKAGNPYPCEIRIRSGDNATLLGSAKLGVPCDVVGTIAKGKLDASLYCFATEQFLDEIAHVAAKLQSIPGGFAFESKTDIVRSRRVDPKATHGPFKTVDETDHVVLGVSVCRKPWPSGFNNEVEELEKHPRK